jgi:RNA polymerase sigma factor (sigma-70 family)
VGVGDLVIRVKDGDLGAFEVLVLRYRRRAFGLAMKGLRGVQDAEEAVQDAFLKTFMCVKNLEKPEAFSAWLFRICRNCVLQRARRSRRCTHAVSADVVDDPADTGGAKAEWDDYFDVLRAAIGMPKPNLREAIQLRFFAGLSTRETAAVCGIDPALVKSRVQEAKRKLRALLPSLHEGVTLTPEMNRKTMEVLMKTLDFTRKGASVMERLSLHQRTGICMAVKAKETFPEPVLEAVGLVDILNYVDQMTEKRVIEHLEEADPEFAETVKQNMFVFEDLVLFDERSVKALIPRVKEEDLVLALSSTIPEVKEYILSAFPEADREKWIRRIHGVDAHGPEITRARFAIIEECRRMNWDGAIKCGRDANGKFHFTVVA